MSASVFNPETPQVWQQLEPVLKERSYDVRDRLMLMKCTHAAFVALNESSEPLDLLDEDGSGGLLAAAGDATVLASVRSVQKRLLKAEDGHKVRGRVTGTAAC